MKFKSTPHLLEDSQDIWDVVQNENKEDIYREIPNGYKPLKQIGFDREEFERLKAERAEVYLIPNGIKKRLRIIIDYDPQTKHTLARYFTAPELNERECQ